MGQIETKDSDNSEKSDSKEVLAKSEAVETSNDTKINFEDNSGKAKGPQQRHQIGDKVEDPRLTKAKTCDFACTIFYAMVAMLLFSTMSHTYHRTSGGCGGFYGVQSLLAYSCVGLAVAIIRSLRQNLKDQIKDLTPDEWTLFGEADPHRDRPKPKDTDQSKESVAKNEIEKEPNADKAIKFDSILIDVPYNHVQYAGEDKNKLSTGLPLPSLPPLDSSKRFITNTSDDGMSQLSAVDLKAIAGDVHKFADEYHCQKGRDNVRLSRKEWDQEFVEHRVEETNRNESNVNAIDKYI